MNAGKSQFLAVGRIEMGEWAAHFARSDVGPADHPMPVVEKEIALSLALADHEQHVVLVLMGIEAGKIGIAQNVDIVNEDRRVGCGKQGEGLPKPTTGVEQRCALIGNVEVYPKIMLGKIVNNLLAKVMNVHHHFGGPGGNETAKGVFQEWAAAHGN